MSYLFENKDLAERAEADGMSFSGAHVGEYPAGVGDYRICVVHGSHGTWRRQHEVTHLYSSSLDVTVVVDGPPSSIPDPVKRFWTTLGAHPGHLVRVVDQIRRAAQRAGANGVRRALRNIVEDR